MATHGYFFIGTGDNKELLGYLSMDGYPWEGNGYKRIIASTSEAEFRQIAADMNLTPADPGVNYPIIDLSTFEYAYCWEDGYVKVLADGQPYKDGGDLKAWREKILSTLQPSPKPSVHNNFSHRIAEEVLELCKLSELGEDPYSIISRVQAFCEGVRAVMELTKK